MCPVGREAVQKMRNAGNWNVTYFTCCMSVFRKSSASKRKGSAVASARKESGSATAIGEMNDLGDTMNAAMIATATKEAIQEALTTVIVITTETGTGTIAGMTGAGTATTTEIGTTIEYVCGRQPVDLDRSATGCSLECC